MADTTEAMKAEVAATGKPTWRDNANRLIWCGPADDGGVTFKNTTSATRSGPKISEAEAARILSDEAPWTGPRS